MQPPPPVGYSPYPRATVYGSATKLKYLQKAYVGAYFLIPTSLVVAFVGAFTIEASGLGGQLPEGGTVVAALCLVVIANSFVSFRSTKILADCRGKGAGYAVGPAVLAALCSLLCWGLAGVAILQSPITSEIRRYGIKPGFFGIPAAAMAAKIEELTRQGQP